LDAGELEEAAGAGLVGGFDATEPGEAAAEGGGLAAFADPAFAADSEAEAATAPEETAAPCGAGLAPPAGAGLSSSFGARAPMLARSWPMRIFPRKTGRSKM